VVIPTAPNVVTFKIEGPATFDHGGTMTSVNPKDGKAMTAITLQGSSGVIRITTQAAGLAPARTQIQRRGR
jgi:hypothetical protein